MFDVRRLVIFREVAARGSFSEAALELNYSQSAVSHHIGRLELEVGARLLERGDGRQVSLTPAGTALLEHTDRVIESIGRAETAIAELGGSKRQLRLGAFATASATVVAETIGRLHERRPDLELTLLEAESMDTLRALRGHRLDLGVVFDDERHPLDLDGFSSQHVLFDPLLLALPRDHGLVEAPSLELGALRNEAWIEGAGAETPCSLILHDYCRAAGFEPRVAFNSGNYWVVQTLVAAGVGVALVPSLGVEHQHPGVVFKEIAPGPVRRVWIVWAGGEPSEASREFIELLGESVARRPRIPELASVM